MSSLSGAGPSSGRLAPGDIPETAGDAVRERFEAFGPAYRWLLLVAMLCGALSTMLAATTINVALPAIIGVFGLGQDQAQWMSTAFLAASTIAMLANAWAMSAFGPRATYLAGIVLFVAGSLLGAVSATFELLIVSRALQGVAAGLLQPMSMFLIFQAFPNRMRGTAMGVFSIGVVLAPAFGPALGGVAVDLASWRLVFVATVPLAVVAGVMAVILMPRRDGAPDAKRPPLDWLGLILVALSLTSFLAFIANGDRDGWGSDITLARLAIALACGALFLWWERRHPFPALNPRVFQHWQFTAAGVVIAFTGMAIYGSTYLIPIFVQVVQGYSPTAAGIMMIPAGLVMVACFPLAGRLTDRIDARLLLGFGAAAFGGAMYLMSGVAAATPYWVLVGWIAWSRVGISFCMPPANTTAVRGTPPHILASATGAASFLMQVGGALGVAMLAVFLQRRMIFHGEHLSSAIDERNAEFLYQHGLGVLEHRGAGLPYREAFRQAYEPVAQAVAQEATVLAFRESFLMVAVGFAAVFLFVLFMPKPNLDPPSPPAR
ncbi:MAG: DHA2 family efflux MFS transporter permease subunit [Pseudomonadota bacterium]